MDRRAFLKTLFAARVATAIDIPAAIEQILVECEPMSDYEFVQYMTYQINMYIANPAKCMVITGIGEDQ